MKIEDFLKKIQVLPNSLDVSFCESTLKYLEDNVELISSVLKSCDAIKKIVMKGSGGDEASTCDLVKLSKSGDQDTLSVLLELCLNTVENFSQSYCKEILEVAIEELNPSTIYTLAIVRHELNCECKETYEQLEKYRDSIEILANKGRYLAQYQIGWYYKKINKNYNFAIKFYSMGAIQHLPSLHALGDLYEEGFKYATNSYLINAKSEHALACYQKGSELGYGPSQEKLGFILLMEKNYVDAFYWITKNVEQGYTQSIYRLKRFRNGNYEKELKDWADLAVITLMKIQIKEQVFVKKNSFLLASDDKELNKDILQKDVLQSGYNESQKVKESDRFSESHDEETCSCLCHMFSLTSIIYDNPQALAEIQVSDLMNLVGKNVSKPETQMGQQNHVKEMSVFNEELRSFLPMKQPSLMNKAPMVSLTQAAFLDEKLVSQAEYFAQTGVAFSTLQDAAGVGTVHMLGELPPTEEESVLDYAIDWMGLSHLWQWDHSEDLSILP